MHRRPRSATPAAGRTGAMLLALALAACPPALAQQTPHEAQVTAADPERVLALLAAAGHAGEIATTAYGDPEIRISEAELPFQVRFYGCVRGRDCLSIQFIAGFATTGVTAEDANEWNRAMRYARAHVNDAGQAFVAYDVNLDAGGVSEANFNAQLALWGQLLDRFVARIGF